MKIVYMSDLHLIINGAEQKQFEPGDVLILAGDTVDVAFLNEKRTDQHGRAVKKNFNKLIDDVFPLYRKVIMVMGNHEHYHGVFQDTYSDLLVYVLDRMGPQDKFHLMENDNFILDDVMFIGATLWTDFDKHSYIAMWDVQRGMNDYSVIENATNPGKAITPHTTLKAHIESRDYIKYMLAENKDMKKVVVTHHCPSWQCLDPKHAGDSINAAYASALDDVIFDSENLLAWIHGHTHYNTDFKIGNTRILSNQKGYQGHDRSSKNFKPAVFIEV